MPDFLPPEVDVPVRLIAPDASTPRYALPGDAGADLTVAEDVELAPLQRALVGTGVAVAIPDGYAGFVHPRSGLAHRLDLASAVWTLATLLAEHGFVDEATALMRRDADAGNTDAAAWLDHLDRNGRSL